VTFYKIFLVIKITIIFTLIIFVGPILKNKHVNACSIQRQ